MKTLLRRAYQHAASIFLVWFAVIFALCATPGEYIPSNNWLDLLSVDKLVHAGMFFVLYLSAALFILRKKGSKTFFLVALLFCLSYGLSLEIMQATLFRNRSADYKDMIANSLGCFAAFACLPALRKHHTSAV
jgi:VanZ family protein